MPPTLAVTRLRLRRCSWLTLRPSAIGSPSPQTLRPSTPVRQLAFVSGIAAFDSSPALLLSIRLWHYCVRLGLADPLPSPTRGPSTSASPVFGFTPMTQAVNHPPDRRTSWPRSGSALRLAPFVLPRVGQIIVQSGVSVSCTPQNSRSSGIFEFTGLSTAKPTNPQMFLVHPHFTHRFAHRPPFVRARRSWRRTGSRPGRRRRGAHRLTSSSKAGTMTTVIGYTVACIIIIP